MSRWSSPFALVPLSARLALMRTPLRTDWDPRGNDSDQQDAAHCHARGKYRRSAARTICAATPEQSVAARAEEIRADADARYPSLAVTEASGTNVVDLLVSRRAARTRAAPRRVRRERCHLRDLLQARTLPVSRPCGTVAERPRAPKSRPRTRPAALQETDADLVVVALPTARPVLLVVERGVEVESLFVMYALVPVSRYSRRPPSPLCSAGARRHGHRRAADAQKWAATRSTLGSSATLRLRNRPLETLSTRMSMWSTPGRATSSETQPPQTGGASSRTRITFDARAASRAESH